MEAAARLVGFVVFGMVTIPLCALVGGIGMCYIARSKVATTIYSKITRGLVNFFIGSLVGGLLGLVLAAVLGLIF